MYKIKNGILYKNEKKTFVIGESYYPSFHPSKFPVPPEGDRYGEMIKDLKMMSEAGFNHVRFAAVGDTGLGENGKVEVRTPFVDDMIKEAAKNDLSVSIRQQGFSVNLRGFTDADMIDRNGYKTEFRWSDFVRTTLNHEGILEDNRTYARAVAEHYAKSENVVAYQMYNEPKYPQDRKNILDYHPKTIKTYRQWLVEKGVFTEQETEIYDPPHSRDEQSPRMWALWRIFSIENMNAFLKNAADGSKQGSELPVFTCFTTEQISAYNSASGTDMFGNAKFMDMIGFTTYIHANGVGYYPMCLHADLAQCAAELEGKQSICIELDSRTYIPHAVYNRGTYAILGAGGKGIIYYQWRGDCPYPGVPHPNSCGILNYDGTKTANFENAVNVNRYLSKMNDLVVNANRLHEGVGLLHSEYAAFICDANELGDTAKAGRRVNGYLTVYSEIYRQLRNAGFNVSITDAAHLKENRFNIKVLYVPSVGMLSPEEKAAVNEAHANGVRVFENSFTESDTNCIAFKEYGIPAPTTKLEEVFSPYYSVYDVEEITNLAPTAEPLVQNLGVQILEGDGYKLLVLTNNSFVKKELCAKLRVNIPFKSAEFCAIDGEKPVTVNGNELSVNITDGGVLILR